MTGLSKPLSEFSSEELMLLLDAVSSEFKRRNSKFGLSDKPVSIKDGIKILGDILAGKIQSPIK